MTNMEKLIEFAQDFRAKVERAVQSIPDAEAEELAELLPMWNPNGVYTQDDVGMKIQYDGHPYRIRQAHTAQPQYTPDIIYALYERIAPQNETGDDDSPIQFMLGMAVENGKVYEEDGILYDCFRDSVNPLYNYLVELVGLYVNVRSDAE